MSAIQVFRYESGKYVLDVKAFEDIMRTSANNLVAIYTMSGPLRFGKSFMLGFFVRYMKAKGKGDWISYKLENEFKYRGGSVRETTGIWMWSEPFVVEKDGRKISVFLLDTQGCFDEQTTMTDNAIVFALSTLLSSVMIFNIKCQLSEDILQFLQYFAGFARLADEENKDEPFQRLMFLVRDWQFDDFDYGYYDDNTSINGKNFKTSAFNIHNGMPKDVKFVHESILSTFENVSFYLLPHPGNAVARKSVFSTNSVDQDFLHHLSQIVPLVLKDDNIVVKKIGGDYITGAQMIKFVEKWAEVFKRDSVPDSMTVFEATATIQNEMAKSAAIENYNKKMKEQMKNSEGMHEIDYISFNNSLTTECIELYKSFKRLGGKKYEDKYVVLLMDELNKYYEFYLQLNSTNLRFNEIKKSSDEESKRLEDIIKENVRKMNELTEENKVERNKYLQKIDENQKSLNEWRIMFANAEKARQEDIKRLTDQINQLRSEPSRRRKWYERCSVM